MFPSRAVRSLLVLAVCGALSVYLWQTQPRPQAGVGYALGGSELAAFAEIRINGFEARSGALTGSVDIRFAPGTSGMPPDSPAAYAALLHTLDGYDAVTLSMEERRQDAPGGRTREYILLRGESERLKLSRERGVTARGNFRMHVDPVAGRGPLTYPFDRYELRPSPTLWAHKDGVSAPLRIESLSVDLSGVNFSTRFSPGRRDSVWMTVTLERPAWLRVVASVALALFLLWAVLRPLSAKPTEPSELLALFGGIFGLRTSLLSGAPVTPNLIDYVSILAYVYVVAMLLWAWLARRPKPQCPFCQSDVHAQATVCAACTRELVRPA